MKTLIVLFLSTLAFAESSFVGPLQPVVVTPEHPTPQQVLVLIGCDPLTATCTA